MTSRACIALGLLLALPAAAAEADCASTALELLHSLKDSKWEAAVKDFGPDMLAQLPATRLETVMQQVHGQFGAMGEPGAAKTREIQAFTVVTVPVAFEKGTLEAIVSCTHGTTEVRGLRLIPANVKATPVGPPTGPSDVKRMKTTVGPFDLRAEVTLPEAKRDRRVPGIVIVHGSGPIDLDGTLGANRPYGEIAEGLAARGVACIRYDKRTYSHKEAFAGKDFGLREEVIDDAVAAAARLREVEGVDPERIFILGHSVGAGLAPRIAAAAHARGAILMAAPARPVDVLAADQLKYLASVGAEVKDANGRPVQAQDLLRGLPEAYVRELHDLDAVKDAKRASFPVLVLQGGRDYQVTNTDYRIWSDACAAVPRISCRAYPALNHLFIAGSGTPTPAEYQQRGHVAPEVLDDVARWIAEN